MNGEEIAEILIFGIALSHPTRLAFLELAAKEPISPVTGFRVHHLGSLGVVSYHAFRLEKLECVEVTHTRLRRGTTEHIFEATQRGMNVVRIAGEIRKIVNPVEPGETKERSGAEFDDHSSG